MTRKDLPTPHVDVQATLARFTDEERAKYAEWKAKGEAEHAQALEGAEGYPFDDYRRMRDPEAYIERYALTRALGLAGYIEGIWEIDPTVNPVGVEEFMRAQYSTLNHLPLETFIEEVALAKEAERQQPGILRSFAAPTDEFWRYDQAQKLVQEPPRIVRPEPPRIAAPPQLIIP